MISKGCRNLVVLCNSGALKAEFIGTIGFSKKMYAKVGDVIKVAIKEAIPNALKAKKGKVFFALLVATKFPQKDMYDNCVSFAYNGIILLQRDIKGKLIPVANRVNYSISRQAMVDGPVAVNRVAVNKVLSTAKGVY